MVERRLKLTRDQLASFLKDHDQIKQFERLFGAVDDMSNDDAASLSGGSADAKAQSALDQLRQIRDALELAPVALPCVEVQDTGPPPVDLSTLESRLQALESLPAKQEHSIRRCYGAFSSTVDQTAAAINTAYAMTYDTTDLAQGVTIGSTPSEVYLDARGVYNVQFSAQVHNAGGAPHNIWIWLNINGSPVANTSTAIRIEGNNTEVAAAWNFVRHFEAGDYFELMWEVSDTGVSLQAEAATGVHPAIPSVILTVTDNISD
jgi:hypothetical protein